MGYPVTLNGRTYTLADFEGTNYVDGLPDAFEDFVTHAGAIYKTTSTTSNTIGTGSKSFTTADNSLPYQEGTPLRISDGAAPSTNWMDAIVTAYSGTSLTVNVVSYAGSGTLTDWDINIGGGGTSYTGTLPIAQGGTGATTAGDAATNLGVGTGDSPTFAGASIGTIEGGADGTFKIKTNANNHAIAIEENSGSEVYAIGTNANGDLGFYNSGSTTASVVFDDSGNVGVGTESPTNPLHVYHATTNVVGIFESGDTEVYVTLADSDSTTSTTNRIGATGNDLHFWTTSTERMRIDSDGNIGFGTDAPQYLGHFVDGDVAIVSTNTTNNAEKNSLLFGATSSEAATLAAITCYRAASINNGELIFKTNGGSGLAEIARFDTDGNLLIGQTSASDSAAGIYAAGSGRLSITRDGSFSLRLNRKTNDGTIIDFRQDNTAVGSILTQGGYLAIGSDATGIKTHDGLNALVPWNTNTNAARDNAIDLASSSTRFDDVYATNGTIQTSDANEKRDVAELDEAEKRVATAAKGLIRKFRWISSVEEKGDDARIHVGVIAQDLKAAFEAEGLDPGRYAMFISTTWWETQTEVPAVEAVEAQDAVYEDVVIPAIEEELDEEGNVIVEAQPERIEQRLVSEAIEGVEAKDSYIRTDIYETAEDAPEGAVERTRLGVRYNQLLAFIIGAL